ncbi:MAG: hypothetical protein KDK23_09965 [Leptospiraceae bacterium]|nr:hypothetical protein [Leptospiraceae bacterium]
MLTGGRCSAPGPVLPAISAEVFRGNPLLYEVQPFQGRFRDNIAAYFQILDNGSAELWQLSLDRQGRIRLLQFQGMVFESSPGPFQLRLQKCFIHGQDLPSSDRVPLEVFQCDHLALGFRRSSACPDCLESTPLLDPSVDNAPSSFLHGLQLKPLKASEYSGKKIDAFSNATEVWYWGAVWDGGRIKEGSYAPGTVVTVVDGFVMLEGSNAPDRIVLPLPVSEGFGL